MKNVIFSVNTFFKKIIFKLNNLQGKCNCFLSEEEMIINTNENLNLNLSDDRSKQTRTQAGSFNLQWIPMTGC